MIEYIGWIEYQENVGRSIQIRMEEILAKQGKRDSFTVEDVQSAERQARKDLGLSS
jgi:hypothetical protein